MSYKTKTEQVEGQMLAQQDEQFKHLSVMLHETVDMLNVREGLHVFEPGAQGEHKIARGFLPTFVRSRHWIADPAFADALRRWCVEESASVRSWKALLDTRSPFTP